jgi:hypothetical protein
MFNDLKHRPIRNPNVNNMCFKILIFVLLPYEVINNMSSTILANNYTIITYASYY